MDPGERAKILEWDARIDSLDYEQILGVDSSSSAEDCTTAYYAFAECFHPDMHSGTDEHLHQVLCRLFQRGSEAYRVLTHPALHTRWLKAKSEGRMRLSDLAPPPPFDLGLELTNLHERCRSAGAKLESKLAAKAFGLGHISEATRHLQQALAYDGGVSLDVARCLEALASGGEGR